MIVNKVLEELKAETPYFDLKLILTGLKIVGQAHVTKILNHI